MLIKILAMVAAGIVLTTSDFAQSASEVRDPSPSTAGTKERART